MNGSANSPIRNLGSISRIPRSVQRGTEITRQDSFLTTTASILERAKKLSMSQNEHCANGSIIGLTGLSFTGQKQILSLSKQSACWPVLWDSGF
jgi:hypothetical protein